MSSFLENGDGSRIFYQAIGSGRAPWMTLVNGYTRPWTDFRSMAKRWTESGFSVLAFDNRGAGQSQVAGPFGLGDMAGDIVRLWDHLDIGSSSLLGISMGGVIAQRTAAKQMDRVERLILVSTCPKHHYMTSTISQWASTVPEVEEQLRVYFTDDFRQKNRLLVEAMAKTICQNAAQTSFNEGARLQRQALEGFDHTALLEKLKLRCLILHGDQDRVIDPSAADELHRLIPGSRLETFPGKGHLLLAEASKEFFDSALGFVTA